MQFRLRKSKAVFDGFQRFWGDFREFGAPGTDCWEEGGGQAWS
jgi:hypothetical protein